jgi:hypothetical protein
MNCRTVSYVIFTTIHENLKSQSIREIILENNILLIILLRLDESGAFNMRPLTSTADEDITQYIITFL